MKKTFNKSEKKTHWNDVSSWYDDLVGQEGSEYHVNVIFPNLLKLLKERSKTKETKYILDLACGQGALCRLLNNEGYKVTGVELAKDLLKSAKNRTKDNSIMYLHGDVTKLIDENKQLIAPFRESTYDAITIILAIQNMSPLSPIWTAVKKLLKKDGDLYLVMMHPCFRIPQHADWRWNEKEHRQERTIWKYLKSKEIPITAHPGKKASNLDDTSTIHFHRPIQAYINTLSNAGLYVTHFDEWVSHKKEQKGIKSEAIDNAREEFPMFLCLRATKIKED